MAGRDRMRFFGRGARVSGAGGLRKSFRRLGWAGLAAMCRGGVGLRQRRHHCESARLGRWRRAAQCLPCWGLGVKAGWPWG
jgi:hypothetical protein